MRKLMLAAVGAALLGMASPALAQEMPLVGGDYWDVTAVTIDDGRFGDYADFLAAGFRKESEYAKSKGWIKGYYILSNVNPRKDEPDLYLVRITDHVPTPAEETERNKEVTAYLQTTDRQMMAESGARAKFRHVAGSMLLQAMVWAH